MLRLLIYCAFIIVVAPLPFGVSADTKPLNLQCDVIFTNYRGIDHAATQKKVSLTALKQQTGGARLVT